MNEDSNKKELPKGWKWVKLEDTLDYIIGGDWGKDENFDDSNYGLAYCIRGSEFKNWKDDKGKTASLRKIKLSNIEKRKLVEGDILVEISGGGPEQPVGRTVLIDKTALRYKPGIPKICTNFLRLIRPKDNINSNFLDLYLKLFYYSGEVVKYQGGSNNLRNLKFPDYIKIVIPLPPKAVQQVIVSKIEELFSELDKGIENLHTAQQQLKTYRQVVLQWAFEGKLTNNLKQNSYTLNNEQVLSTAVEPSVKYKIIKKQGNLVLKDEDIDNGKLLDRWKWVTLGEYLEDINSGKSYRCDERAPQNGEIGIVKVSSVSWGFFDEMESKTCLSNDLLNPKYIINKGDFLFSRANTIELIGACVIVSKIDKKLMLSDKILRFTFSKEVLKKFILHYLRSPKGRKQIEMRSTGNQDSMRNIGQEKIRQIKFPFCSIAEQHLVVEAIESRLSVADKLEETITQSLQQAEALRQSILKKAFEGKLLYEEHAAVYKPKNEYFYQMQLLALIASTSRKKNITHGEMTIAKYAYLVDKIYHIPTYYNFERWHLGPYPPEIKKAINNKKFFKITSGDIQVTDEATLFKYNNHYQEDIESAVNDLVTIFSKYPGKERSHKTELLATVCKVVEDIQSLDLQEVRTSMKNWEINLRTTSFKNKAEKFTEDETRKCLAFLIEKEWDKELMGE